METFQLNYPAGVTELTANAVGAFCWFDLCPLVSTEGRVIANQYKDIMTVPICSFLMTKVEVVFSRMIAPSSTEDEGSQNGLIY